MPTHPSKIAHFEIVRVIGEGGMSFVYQGHNPEYPVDKAIKTIRTARHTADDVDELERRFTAEAKVGAILAHHPNIVQVFDKGRDGGLAYIVMELVQGDDLDKSLVPGQGLPIGRALAIVDELLQALGHAHAKGIIHRDIKPANLMIDPLGHVKLTDFGIARITESDDVTRFRGVAVGTTSYMSPEQTRCDPLDYRSDLWSTGVLLYLLLTGKLPFVGDDGGSATEKIQHVAPVPPSHLRPGLPAAINGVVAKALQKNREHRYADAATFAYALREANEETVGRPAAKSLPKRSKKVVLAAVLALLGLAAGFAFVSPREAKPTVAAVCPPTQVLNDGQCGCPPGRSLENLVCVQPAPAPAQAPAPVACSLPNVMVGGQCVPCSSLKDNPLMYQGLGCDKVQ